MLAAMHGYIQSGLLVARIMNSVGCGFSGVDRMFDFRCDQIGFFFALNYQVNGSINNIKGIIAGGA
jgi:hypothetical protein